MPLFWPENIETWFIQSESQFRLKGVSVSQTKFNYCVQSMTQDVAMKVFDMIRNPPTNNPYQHLKNRLLPFLLLMTMPAPKLLPTFP